MYTIDGESFFTFTKNTLIGDSGISCHITNNDAGMYYVIEFNEPVQGSSGDMKATN